MDNSANYDIVIIQRVLEFMATGKNCNDSYRAVEESYDNDDDYDE